MLVVNGREIMSRYCVISDIDNVYTDSREWFKHVPQSNSREEWDHYHTLSTLCKPNKHVIDMLGSVADLIPIMFVTSREDRHNSRRDTIRHIEEFSNGRFRVGENCFLFMRREFDYRPSADVKKEIVNSIVAHDFIPILAIDDDESNCEMFKSLGIPTNRYFIEDERMEKYFVVGARV